MSFKAGKFQIFFKNPNLDLKYDFRHFLKRFLILKSFCLLLWGVSLNSFPLTSVKTQLEQKKWLPVQRTTLWASSSLTRVSLELFSSTSSQPFPSENLFRNTLGKWKSHFFLQHNIRPKIFCLFGQELDLFLPFLGTWASPHFFYWFW